MGTEQINKRPKKNLADRLVPELQSFELSPLEAYIVASFTAFRMKLWELIGTRQPHRTCENHGTRRLYSLDTLEQIVIIQ